MENWVKDSIKEKQLLLDTIAENGYLKKVETVSSNIYNAIKNGGKIMIAGNGGSASDAQHFTCEMVGRFLVERNALPAVTLTVDPSVMTAISNDYGYEQVVARQVSAIGTEKDILFVISTSGNSKNLIEAVKIAEEKNITVMGLLGKGGGTLCKMCDYSLVVPSDKTPRIQEIHTYTIHLICQWIDTAYKYEKLY